MSQHNTNPAFAGGGILIEAAELHIVSLPLITPFVISNQTLTDKTFPLLVLKGEGIEGIAEAVMDQIPDYLEETIPAAMAFLQDVLLPRIVGKRFASPYELEPILAPWRGNRMAKAVVEMAFWDLWAKSLGIPLKAALGGVRGAVDVGVSIGIGSVELTLERIAEAQAAGYKRTKLKIAKGHDVALLDAVRARYPDIKLTVDANTDYGLEDLALLRRFDEFDLDYIEQPLAFDDIHDHAQVQAALKTAICLDESIRNAGDARKALEMRAARVINIKVGRVGGFAAARAIHDVSAAFGVPVWCGGMLEAGIGRAHNIHLATLANFTKPGDTSSASRYFKRDIVNEPLEAANGEMPVPNNGAGIGVTLDRDYMKSVTSHSEMIRP
ncbi:MULTISPECIES: o-succinylbenzoate synthase [unclassified Sulfitobacter]|jgi:O-succinylbenzoate synthase|uniref:o-succinylbenzoate synthase n=1 Tax=unclassified Sulfitobacter TaxID=196795 RepID=UPI0007C32538|nr:MULTISPECIES: o-succinylbenzoate synthase [unclassified Sulfitobacter]KZX98810.1 o-succinylbenzoate synthase [Sulfitobacter sp. HI0021]KZY03779.1 o-succinylbenzoate synthase [Sulfitobacter sp. HI0027]KZZ02003.1 o-succinylbenzoate synthase [Sulfitobacter sp. HI0076]